METNDGGNGITRHPGTRAGLHKEIPCNSDWSDLNPEPSIEITNGYVLIGELPEGWQLAELGEARRSAERETPVSDMKFFGTTGTPPNEHPTTHGTPPHLPWWHPWSPDVVKIQSVGNGERLNKKSVQLTD